MGNQTIGIGGVFIFTFFLFVLRHFLLALGQSKSRRYDAPIAGNDNLNRKADADDAWLLWTPDPNPRTGSSKRVGDW